MNNPSNEEIMNNPSNEEIIKSDECINISTFQSTQAHQQHRLYYIDLEWDDKTIKNNSDVKFLSAKKIRIILITKNITNI